MLNERLTAARRIADALGPAEADIEAAIASTSRLITKPSGARLILVIFRMPWVSNNSCGFAKITGK